MQKIQAVLLHRLISFSTKMLWAACRVVYFGFLRPSEFTVQRQGRYDSSVHLSLSDIALDNRYSSVIQIRLKQSKTDPFRQGVYIYLGKTGQSIFPVSAIVQYLTMRRGAQGPLFILEDGKMLNRQISRRLSTKSFPKQTWLRRKLTIRMINYFLQFIGDKMAQCT